MRLIITKWKFARVENQFLRAKFRLEVGWNSLALLDKESRNSSRKNLREIEMMVFAEEEKIEKTRGDISFLEDSLGKMIRIARKI